ncbi:uncharacterized protein SCHCODRAFT_02190071 [Schizophyllum commune H4-8]|nr:uncharacterized protein SCHCODRAFT_02190071 [Schizophyllum commune H4-8]KAI5896386.1 hypothetical protein SCHCODRAFT_02190071 [Schizophyllum commune H4-8]
MASVNLPPSQRFDFSDVAPWIGASAPSLRQRYVPGLPEELWESDLNGRDAIAPYANDVCEGLASIERDREAMRAHREQVASLLRGMDALNAGLDDVACRLHSRMAPVHQLPSELLALVFRFCVREEAIPLCYDASPGLLTHVCRRWRSIAHEEPTIWSHIDATATCPRGYSKRGRLYNKGASSILSAFLGYSKNLPLIIMCPSATLPEPVRLACSPFLAECHRVRNLEAISGHPFVGQSWLKDESEKGFPLLEHLDLSRCSPYVVSDLSFIFPAPALRSIVLPPVLSAMSKDLSQTLKYITTYFGPIVGNYSINVLRDMPNLEKCTIIFDDNGRFYRLEDLPSRSAMLNNARTLQLNACDGQVFEAGWYFSAPHVETLRILQPSSCCLQTRKLIKDIGCHSTLVHLSVAVLTGSEDAPTMLEFCPSVRTLELLVSDSLEEGKDARVFSDLADAVAGGAGLLPELRVLRIITKDADRIIPSPALQRLVHRLAAMQPPRLTDLEFGIPKDDVARYRDLVGDIYATFQGTTRVRVMDWAFEDPVVEDSREVRILY